MSESEASVATRSPAAKPRAAGGRPTQITRPSSMPPEPVTGLCCLPRVSTVWRTSSAMPSSLPPAAVIHLAKARGVDVERLDRQVDLALEATCDIVVEPPRRLRERPRGLEDAVASQGIAEHCLLLA